MKLTKKILAISLCLALLLSTMGTVVAMAAIDLPVALVNGDFENDVVTDGVIPGFNNYFFTDNYKFSATEVSDPLSVRTGKVVKIDCTTGGYTGSSSGCTGFYQTVNVKKNTDYQWSMYVYCNVADAPNRVGVVAADALSNADIPTLDVTYVGEGVSCTQNNIGDSLCCISKATWAANPDWVKFYTTNNAWAKLTVKFNSGDNEKVSLTYVPYKNANVCYFDDWTLSEKYIPAEEEIYNGDFEQGLVGFTILNGGGNSGSATIVDGFAGHTSKVLKMDYTDASAGYNKFGVYQSVAVKKNTDYIWTFDMNCTTQSYHLFGVVAGDTVKDTKENISLPITASCDKGNVTISDNNAPAWGLNIAATTSGDVDTNWKSCGNFNQWATFTVKFNSGDNTNVCLAYSSMASGRVAYFDNWAIEKAPEPMVIPTGYKFLDASGIAFVGETADPLSVKEGKVIKVDTTGTTKLGSVSFYKPVAVKKNTDYIWTFDAYVAAGDYHRFGVVAGDTVVDTNANVALETTLTTNPGGITVSNTGADSNGEYVCKKAGTWDGDPNWKYIQWTANGWATISVKFNSGDNTTVSLAYAPRAYNRIIYFTDWSVAVSDEKPIGKLVNGDFSAAGAKDNSIPGYKVLLPKSGPVASVVDSAEGRTGKILKMDATEYDGNVEQFAIYQPVKVNKNTDYVWTFDMDCVSGANHHIGIVAGRTVSNTSPNTTLPIKTCVCDQRNGVTIANNTSNGYIVATDYSTWGVDTNWKEFGAFNKWTAFTVTFNSGDNDYVCLAYSTRAVGRLAYLDNWNLVQKDGTNLINGDFSSGFVGYDLNGDISAVIVEESGNNVAKVQGTASAFAASISQKITVNPYTEYIWTFDYKNIQGGNSMFSVCKGSDTSVLLPSIASVTTGGLAYPRFFEQRSNAAANNHQGQSSQVATVTIKFYTCDETSVYLTFNPIKDDRIVELDNWNVVKSTVKKGDANADGVFSASDLATIKLVVLNAITSSESISALGADANGDYKVDILDIINLKKSFAVTDLPEDANGYRLVWSDEFDGTALGSSLVTTNQLMDTKDDALVTRGDSTGVEVKDGSLYMKSGCISREGTGTYYVGEQVTSKGKMAFKQGYLEIRAKVPYGAPSMAAFWMQSAKVDNETGAEIDIFEAFPALDAGVQSGIHKWHANNGGHDVNNAEGKIGQSIFGDEDIAEQWHTYGLLWTDSELKFYVDGNCYHTIDITEAGNFGDGDMACFQDYAYVILNNWLYIAETADEKDTEYVADPEYFSDGTIDFQVDYIRLYQSASQGDIIYR